MIKTRENIAHNQQCDDSQSSSTSLCPSVVYITKCIFSHQLDCLAPQFSDMFSRHLEIVLRNPW